MILFGCEKPGGRPLSDQRVKQLGPDAVCPVKKKSTGETIYYKKPGAVSAEKKERYKNKLTEYATRHAKTKEGSKNRQRIEKLIENTRQRIAGTFKRVVREKQRIMRTVDEIPPAIIEFDPKRFQYKITGQETKTGESGSLSETNKYNPDLAGILQVWKDPENGKIFVVNGHNRLNLAKRSEAESVAVRFLNVGTAKEARAIGALTNIAEGQGNSLDAAKFFRDSGIGPDDLRKQGIQIKDRVAEEGLAISRLPRLIYDLVADGGMDLGVAVSIGKSGLDENKMFRLHELVAKEEKKGRKVDGALVDEMSDLIRSSSVNTKKSVDLYGEYDEEEDVFAERAQLQSDIKRLLSKEKRVFGTAARGQGMLERAGNKIDAETTLAVAKQAAEFGRIFDQFKTDKALSNILDASAKRLKYAESRAARIKIRDEAYTTVYRLLPQLIEGLGIKQERPTVAAGPGLFE